MDNTVSEFVDVFGRREDFPLEMLTTLNLPNWHSADHHIVSVFHAFCKERDLDPLETLTMLKSQDWQHEESVISCAGLPAHA